MPDPTQPKPAEPAPSQPEPTPTVPQPTEPPVTLPPVTEPPATEPPATEPPATEPAPTSSPVTEPPPTDPPVTEPAPTEPIGCNHEWVCIHHDAEGHWIAGVICDCGWTIYGDPDELVTAWNAHSSSYPPEESLFEHGGFGSADEWIVDKPAYDEWVCRRCGEQKP